MKRVWLRVGAVVLVAGLVLSVAGATGAAPRHAARPVRHVGVRTTSKVKIVDFSFKPKTITISKGEKVKWTNKQSGVPHTVTANSGSFDSGTLSTGDTFTRKFKKVGTFKYHCTIHSSMHGKVIVT